MKYALLCLLFCAVSSLGALTEDERVRAIEETYDRSMHHVSDDLQKWLQKQALPAAKFRTGMLRIDFHQMRKKLSKIEESFLKPSPDISSVLTPLQEYLVSRAPVDETLTQFWQTAVEKNAKTIVALLMPTDSSCRSTPYWLPGRFPVLLPDWRIEYVSEETIATSKLYPSAKLVKRVFAAQGVRSNEQRTITHIHFENWPDNGPPALDLFCFLLDYVDTIHPWDNLPIYVHCAAGIGRSGTFVTAHSIRKELKRWGAKKEINIPQRVIELRTQRDKLVSQACQFQAIYAATLQQLDQSN